MRMVKIMRETKARLVVHVTGIVLLVMLGIHGVFTVLGNIATNMEYDRVYLLLHDQAYYLLLGSLLILAFVHAGIGLRRSIVGWQGQVRYKAAFIFYSILCAFVIYVYLSMVI